jgi:alanyl-tRNA synthetase
MADAIREKAGSGVIVLGATAEGKAQFLAAVSEDLVRRGLHAGRMVKEVARIAGGSGGGQPGLARAGAKDPGRLGEAIAKVPEILAAMAVGAKA